MDESRRYAFLDVMRGVAIVLMVQVHCMGWWLAEPLRSDAVFMLSLVMGWFAGPIFLLLDGCSVAISVDRRRRRGQSPGAIGRRVLIRSGLIFAAGYALTIATFVGTPRADIHSIGVLHCIGLTVPLCYVVFRWLPLGGATLLGVGVVLLTPVLRGQNVMSNTYVQSFLVNIPGCSNYTLFPWLAYALLGVDAGRLLLDVDGQSPRLRRLVKWLFMAGGAVALICVPPLIVEMRSLSGDKRPGELEVQTWFWYPPLLFIIFHVGIVIVRFAGTAWLIELKGWGGPMVRPLRVMGRAALIVFVAHHLLGYRVMVGIGQIKTVYGSYTIVGAVTGVVLMLFASWGIAEMWQWMTMRRRSRAPESS